MSEKVLTQTRCPQNWHSVTIRGTMTATWGHDLGKPTHRQVHNKQKPSDRQAHSKQPIQRNMILSLWVRDLKQEWYCFWCLLLIHFPNIGRIKTNCVFENWSIGRIWIQSWILKAEFCRWIFFYKLWFSVWGIHFLKWIFHKLCCVSSSTGACFPAISLKCIKTWLELKLQIIQMISTSCCKHGVRFVFYQNS